MGGDTVFEGDGGEAVAPVVLGAEGALPEFVGRGEGRNVSFLTGFHVDLVNLAAIAIGKGMDVLEAIVEDGRAEDGRELGGFFVPPDEKLEHGG